MADDIPELAKADQKHSGIVATTPEGRLCAVGDSERLFTIQSIFRPCMDGLALRLPSPAHLKRKVGGEPSGNAIRLNPRSGIPRNPMIHPGAIATAAQVWHHDPEREEAITPEFIPAQAGRPSRWIRPSLSPGGTAGGGSSARPRRRRTAGGIGGHCAAAAARSPRPGDPRGDHQPARTAHPCRRDGRDGTAAGQRRTAHRGQRSLQHRSACAAARRAGTAGAGVHLHARNGVRRCRLLVQAAAYGRWGC